MQIQIFSIQELKEIENKFMQVKWHIQQLHSIKDVKETYCKIQVEVILILLASGLPIMAECASTMFLLIIFFLRLWKKYSMEIIMRDIFIFTFCFDQSYAYELLCKLDLDCQDDQMVRALIDSAYDQFCVVEEIADEKEKNI